MWQDTILHPDDVYVQLGKDGPMDLIQFIEWYYSPYWFSCDQDQRFDMFHLVLTGAYQANRTEVISYLTDGGWVRHDYHLITSDY